MAVITMQTIMVAGSHPYYCGAKGWKERWSVMTKQQALGVILVTLVTGVSSAAQQPSQRGEVARQLVGRWNLVSLEAVRPNGEVVREWGPKPTGYLSYDASGFVSVQFMRDPRAASQARELTFDERREAFESYYAYYGRFEVDAQEGSVTHHIEGSLRPYEVGTDLKRFFKLSGDRLDLSTPPQQFEAGEPRVYRLIWERVY